MAAKKTTTKKAAGKAIAKKAATGRTAKTGGKKAAKKTAGKMRQVDAAVKVLKQAKKPMNSGAMVEAMQKKGLWKSPGGKRPEATLYASILRDLKKGKEARFKKVDWSLFAFNDGR